MDYFSGTIFSGEFDQGKETFFLTQVKSLYTQSTLSEDKLTELTNYLQKQNGSCMITVNDQVPILLKKDEIAQLEQELRTIMNQLTYS